MELEIPQMYDLRLYGWYDGVQTPYSPHCLKSAAMASAPQQEKKKRERDKVVWQRLKPEMISYVEEMQVMERIEK